MTQAKPTQTTLGIGGEILDQNLLKQIQNTPALSPTSLLNIFNFYRGGNNDALANQLLFIALKIATKPVPTPPPPTSPPVEQATAFTATVASASSQTNEWLDQLEDALWGYIDSEDRGEFGHPGHFWSENIYWLPFSASLPNIGLLISVGLILNVEPHYYIIGFSPDPSSLPTV